MSALAYVNGRYLPEGRAMVHIEDRGFQFADAIYEVCAVRGGALVDAGPHLDRLERSAAALQMALPMKRAPLLLVMRELVRRNRVRHGMLYLQISRGQARRDHPFPAKSAPSLVMTARSRSPEPARAHEAEGVGVITLPDQRWARCDIKSTALLPNILAKQEARAQGAFESWLVDGEGNVTEGASSNAWIVDAEGRLITRPLSPAILGGVTRARLIDLALAGGIEVRERAFTVAEAKVAREAFLTSATAFILPVVRIDERAVGNGRPGGMVARLIALYRDHLPHQS